jgi:hypothetical protein
VLTAVLTAGCQLGSVTAVSAPTVGAPVCARPADRSGIDADDDGLDDGLEECLARHYAPVVYHAPDEPNLPTSVESVLARTDLYVYDRGCRPHRILVARGPLIPSALPAATHRSCDGSLLRADRPRSVGKSRTFFLADVPAPVRRGDSDPRRWPMYFHAYRNLLGGVTVQYWRFYAYNTSYVLGGVRFPLIGDHGGDWEALHVVLTAELVPRHLILLGHRGLECVDWEQFPRRGNHPVAHAGKGGHTTRPGPWETGTAWGPEGTLVNLGEKSRPLQPFLAYAGLWGSRGVSYWSSGYWGPAHNETGEKRDGSRIFITAWCVGMADRSRDRDGVMECYEPDG